MADKMCSLYKKEAKDIDKYLKEVGDGRYLCTKCGRFAEDKKKLCKPVEIEKRFVDKGAKKKK